MHLHHNDHTTPVSGAAGPRGTQGQLLLTVALTPRPQSSRIWYWFASVGHSLQRNKFLLAVVTTVASPAASAEEAPKTYFPPASAEKSFVLFRELSLLVMPDIARSILLEAPIDERT